MEGKIGFCAEHPNQDYKCANCGHREVKTKMTNFYEHQTMDWSDEVCPECGFKSLKPTAFSEEMELHLKAFKLKQSGFD